jgi:valyl-tRNA synthetase
MKYKALLMSLCFLMFQSSVTAEEIYRWVDENGKIHYGNRPKNKDAKVFDKKNIQSIETVKTRIKPIRLQRSSRNVNNRQKSQKYTKNKCDKLKNKMNTLKTQMDRTAHGVKAFEGYKDQIKNLEGEIKKGC